jgi:hypothetical protein
MRGIPTPEQIHVNSSLNLNVSELEEADKSIFFLMHRMMPITRQELFDTYLYPVYHAWQALIFFSPYCF